jgi:dynein heavy chain
MSCVSLHCSTESPEVFGMHANANIAFQLQETNSLLDAVVSIQPRVSGGGNGGSSADAVVAALCDDILEQMPTDLTLDEAAAATASSTACPWCWGRRWSASGGCRV